MKNVYTNPQAEIILLSPLDLIATSGIDAQSEGVGDIASWILPG